MLLSFYQVKKGKRIKKRFNGWCETRRCTVNCGNQAQRSSIITPHTIFLKIQPNTQSIELRLRNKWYKFDEDRTCLVEVPHSQSFSWRTCIFSIFCALPIISAVRLEMEKRSRIPTVLNGHKAIGPRNFWDVEQSDWRNGNYLLANPIDREKLGVPHLATAATHMSRNKSRTRWGLKYMR